MEFFFRSFSLVHTYSILDCFSVVLRQTPNSRVNIAHTLVIRNIRKLSKQSLNHYLSKWFIFLRAHTHTRTSIVAAILSFIRSYVIIVIAPLPPLFYGREIFIFFVFSHTKWMWKSSSTLRNSRITILTAECRWGRPRGAAVRPKWNEDEVQKIAFQQNDVFVRSSSTSSSLCFSLSRFYFKLHTRFVKWAHKMIGKDDSGSNSNSNSRHDDIQTTRKPIKIKPERDVEKFREKPCRNVNAKWMCWAQNACRSTQTGDSRWIPKQPTHFD